MKMPRTDRDESELLATYNKGALDSVATKSELSKFKAAARATAIEDGRVNIGGEPTLRQAVRADVAGIQRVRHAVKENRLTSRVIGDAEVADAIECTGRGWVVEVGAQVVAFAIGNFETGNIWALFVDPAFEAQGHGRRLHDQMLAWLWSRGLQRLHLSTEAGTRAERFYQAAGWHRLGELPNGEVAFEWHASGTRPPQENLP